MGQDKRRRAYGRVWLIAESAKKQQAEIFIFNDLHV